MNTKRLLLVSTLIAAMAASGAGFAKDSGDNGQAMHADGNHWCHQDSGVHALLNLLPDDKRQLLHKTVDKIRKENASLHEQSHKLEGELEALMKAPDFNKEAFLKTQKELDDIHIKMKENAEKEFAGIASEFNAEERKILVELYKLRHAHHDMWDGHHEEQQDKES